MGFWSHVPFELQLNKNFAKLRHSPFKNFLSFKSLLGWSLRFFLGFSFFQQSHWWTKQAIKPVFSPLCSQVFVTYRFFTLFWSEWQEAFKKNWVRREGSHVISLLNLIGFLRLLFLAGVNQLTSKDIFRPRSSQRNTPFTDSPVYFSWGIYKCFWKDYWKTVDHFCSKKLGWGFFLNDYRVFKTIEA